MQRCSRLGGSAVVGALETRKLYLYSASWYRVSNLSFVNLANEPNGFK